MWNPQRQLREKIKRLAEELGVTENEINEVVYYTFKCIKENIEQIDLNNPETNPGELPVFYVHKFGKFIPHIGRIESYRRRRMGIDTKALNTIPYKEDEEKEEKSLNKTNI